MLKHLLVLSAVAAATAPACALGTGDLAFTAYNADEDGISMVTFVNIAAGTNVVFTDNAFVGGAFNTGERYDDWTSGAAHFTFGHVRTIAVRSSSFSAAEVPVPPRAPPCCVDPGNTTNMFAPIAAI